jgi:PHD/YefM family antitoxin component YafN of YafNO toxin-antitoxin module
MPATPSLRGAAAAVVIISLDSFNSLMKRVHLLRCPENAAHLARSIAQGD